MITPPQALVSGWHSEELKFRFSRDDGEISRHWVKTLSDRWLASRLPKRWFGTEIPARLTSVCVRPRPAGF